MNAFLKQLTKFASVGAVATGIHVAMALLFNSVLGITALSANVLAFLSASIFSYLGNWLWTFGKVGTLAKSLPRFAFLNLACFTVNQTIVYFVVVILKLPLTVAMVPVIAIIPAFSFWLNKSRVFIAA